LAENPKREQALTKSRPFEMPAGGLVEGFAVEFDDVAVGIEDVELGAPRYRIGAQLEVVKIVGCQVFAKALFVEPVERFAIAFHTQGEVDVLRIVRSANPLKRAHANNDVEMLFGVANAEPEARKIERRAFDFLQFEDVAVEAPGALEVVDADQNVMKVRFIHESCVGDLPPRDRNDIRTTLACTRPSLHY